MKLPKLKSIGDIYGMHTVRIIGIFLVIGIILTWRVWSAIWRAVSETTAAWRNLLKARYAPTAWKRLMNDILADRIASGISGKWKLPRKLSRLSATGTVNITRLPDGLVTVLFISQIGIYHELRIIRGYLLGSRRLLPKDMELIESQIESFAYSPFDSSSAVPNERRVPSYFLGGKIKLGPEVKPCLYKMDGSYPIGDGKGEYYP